MSVQSGAAEISVTGEAGEPGPPARPGRRRIRPAAALAAPFLAFFVLCFFVSRTAAMTSDAANNALQGYDLLHGHLLLHGWIIGDATFYTFELPLYAITEAVFGLHPLTAHIESAACYTIIAILAAAVAKNRTRGTEAAVRIGIVLAVLAASMDTGVATSAAPSNGIYGPVLLLEEPNHIGTSVFLLAIILLVQRGMKWRATPWLLLALLTLGQLGDATVRYMDVSAVFAVFAWRAIAAREWRGRDALLAVMAIVSVPGSMVLRKIMLHLGAYTMVTPPNAIASPSAWPHNFAIIAQEIPEFFGVVAPHTFVQALCLVVSLVALAAALYGFFRGIRHWFGSEREEQLLVLGIFTYVGAYGLSALVALDTLREVSGILPLFAVLAALWFPRKFVTFRAMVPVVAAAALIPLVSSVVTRPAPTPPAVALASWLEAHHLGYGLAGYWESSAVTLQSSDRVQVRAVLNTGAQLAAYNWETDAAWFDPKSHYANFFIARVSQEAPTTANNQQPADIEAIYGMPTSMTQIGPCVIMVYSYNLLDKVQPAIPAKS